ncbi:MAG: heavy metal translocating P-type ATPase [Bacilli bacterium]|nr:heavy metal translocating P-type ATPase [Bacilli bacterium]
MKKKFDVTGMSCAACQAHVQKAVERLNGVKSVNVNLLQNNMIVEYDENSCSVLNIVDAVKNAGYGASLPEKEVKVKKQKDYDLIKLIISIVILLVIMYFSMGNMMWNWPAPKVFDHMESPLGFSLLQFVLTLPIIVIYFKYFISGFSKLFKGHPNMDTLIAVGSTASMIYGVYCLFMIGFGHPEYHDYLYFESAGMILTLVSLGKYLEGLSKKRTTKAITKLMDLAPKSAIIIKNEQEVTVDIKDVQIGDIVVIKKGDAIPVDGIIIEGSASIDQANITGESMPVYKEVNSSVYSATTLTAGYIKIKATKVGEDTSIANIIRLVDEASNSKAPISKLADKISGIFVPVILSIALVVFIVNYIVSKDFELALNFGITVVVIACPCALGLATPVAIMVGTGKGAENGLLIKNAEILEKAHNIKTIVLDKTGTITEGKPKVVDFISYTKEDLLSVVYSIENLSEHPLASSIVDYSKNKHSKLLEVSNFESIDGRGLKGVINNETYYVGNLKLVDDLNIDTDIEDKINAYSLEGKTPLIIIKNTEVVGIITVKDEVKENSVLAIKKLREKGIKVVMLTGDNKKTAEAIAKEVGVDEVKADVLPTDKQRIINSLKQDDKHLVAMVGDGVNDALALISADLGIAIGAGSDVAIDSADIVLLRNDLLDVLNVISLSKRTLNTIKLGLFWAFFYNFVCVILATGFMYYINGFRMSPMIGSIAMSISSVSVVLNALTINLFKPEKKFKEIQEPIKEEVKMNTEYVISVEGMMCMHCVKHVQNACLSVPGVTSAVASLEENNVVVTHDGTAKREDIVNAIIAADYNAK